MTPGSLPGAVVAPAPKADPGVMRRAIRSSDFWFFDAGSTLLGDRDTDGFHHEFRIRFDADVVAGDALVYARLYLRRAGDSDWLLYSETDDFWISGENGDDDYFVSTTLDDGWPTGDYDVLMSVGSFPSWGERRIPLAADEAFGVADGKLRYEVGSIRVAK